MRNEFKRFSLNCSCSAYPLHLINETTKDERKIKNRLVSRDLFGYSKRWWIESIIPSSILSNYGLFGGKRSETWRRSLVCHLRILPWVETMSSNDPMCEGSREDSRKVNKWSWGRGRLNSQEVFAKDENLVIASVNTNATCSSQVVWFSTLIHLEEDEESWKKKDLSTLWTPYW